MSASCIQFSISRCRWSAGRADDFIKLASWASPNFFWYRCCNCVTLLYRNAINCSIKDNTMPLQQFWATQEAVFDLFHQLQHMARKDIASLCRISLFIYSYRWMYVIYCIYIFTSEVIADANAAIFTFEKCLISRSECSSSIRQSHNLKWSL